jgi:hypothetical protein
MQADPSQQAFAGLIAEAFIEVGTLGTGRRNAHAKAIFAADHAIEELLPFHVLAVAPREQPEMALHQPGQLSPIGKPKILPQMVGPRGSPRNEKGHQ